jgi:hypothetical protein
MIDHLALYRATHQDSDTRVGIELKAWFVRTVRKLAWKVIKMTAEKKIASRRRTDGRKCSPDTIRVAQA